VWEGTFLVSPSRLLGFSLLMERLPRVLVVSPWPLAILSFSVSLSASPTGHILPEEMELFTFFLNLPESCSGCSFSLFTSSLEVTGEAG